MKGDEQFLAPEQINQPLGFWEACKLYGALFGVVGLVMVVGIVAAFWR